MQTLLRVNNLCKSFGEFSAVNQLSFSVNKGDVFGFLGQNGAGKSTTIRMMLSLIRPSSGTIEFFGRNLQLNRNEILQQVGAVIERPDLYKYLSAFENLSLFAKMSGLHLPKKTLMEQLDLVGLAERFDSHVKTFSQGMKQRLGIAVALVHDPEFIILDEPTNGLDPQGIADMRNLILKLSHERGKTILVSSHLLTEIEVIANRMLIINKGKKIVEGEVKSLLDPSKTMVSIETANNLEAFEFLSKSAWKQKLVMNDHHIQLETSKNEIPQIIGFLSENNVRIHSIQPRHSLEDYFLKLTKSEKHVEPFTN